ncbi:MAG: [FeFe] hydrogenase H-cluster maturation GTPase HydF [Calditrichaeota bacterium]|nr:[FeFe] hydrogenase H-cluster maturation GTPase HydF [Calditrichota bacterium]
MKKTPKAMRVHIGLFGRRNAGKSSLINSVTGQKISIVSKVPGTTTDPVEKAMELLPLGPVLFIDTAGVDDKSELGKQRIRKTYKAIERTDVALVIANDRWDHYENDLLERFKDRRIPTIVVFNKADLSRPSERILKKLSAEKIPFVITSATNGEGIRELKELIVRLAPQTALNNPAIVSDLIPPGELVILVTPIDPEAPKGRLILPQVQTIRDILDNDAYCMVVKERELRDALDRLKRPPALVVTDSQAFLKVAGDTPPEVPLTSFSILFARLKGDLPAFVEGAVAIDSLKPNARILIAEACTHHRVGEDIGTVKIPRWLRQYVGAALQFTHIQGHDFPEDLSRFDLVIHCGACTFNRRQMQSRIFQCRQAGVPVTNYGVAIAYSLGVFERALEIFPEAKEIFLRMKSLQKSKQPVA